MKKLNNKGYIEDVFAVIVCLVIGLFVVLLFFALITGWKSSNERVSGIVYNTSNDSLIGGKTRFSVRASEDTYVSEENQSSYCLPHGSKYIDLVNRAAEDKRIKVVVTESKFFEFPMAPWTCKDNVTVTEVK